MDFTFLRLDSIDSTNLEALRRASDGAPEGLVVVAEEQTAGRGRAGRKWISEKTFGLYLSIVLRPKIETQYLSLVTLMSAVAASDVLREEFGLHPDIKWPNDILVNEKKICGILAETAETTKGLAVVVGIGINIRSPGLSRELTDSATSIETEARPEPTAIATGLQLDSKAAITSKTESALLRRFDLWYQVLQKEDGPKLIIDAWHERSTYFSGKLVSVSLGNGSIAGATDGLEPNGALRVRIADGSINIIQSGGVQRLREKQQSH